MVCRRPPGRASAPCRTVQSRAPRSGLSSDYATLIRDASPLHDASTIRGEEMASTLTLLPLTRRGRESTGGCQVLRFAACLTRPDGTSARTLRQPDPVETTHPHRTERRFRIDMVTRASPAPDERQSPGEGRCGIVSIGRTSSIEDGGPTLRGESRTVRDGAPTPSPTAHLAGQTGCSRCLCSGRHSVRH